MKPNPRITPYFVEKPWGGDFIAQRYGLPPKKFGEAWILSTLPEGQSTVEGKKLSQLVASPLTYMVKILDAQENLSIQVHPNNDWAEKLEGGSGKTECWLILEAKEGAGIYLGLKDGVTEAVLRKAIESNQGVDELMLFHKVIPGDFINIPAGTIHALGGGVTLLEVQQASGITYRLWDWNRPGRELHVEKGLKVADLQACHGVQFNVFNAGVPATLLTHEDFSCSYNQSQGEGWFIDLKTFEVYFGEVSHSSQYVFVK